MCSPRKSEFSCVVGTQVDAGNESAHPEDIMPTRQGGVANPQMIDRKQFAAFRVIPERQVRKVCALPGHSYHFF
jgi:hypothetical protein